MANRIQRALPGRAVEITGPLELRLGDAEEDTSISVARIYNFCLSRTADDCEDAAANFVSSVIDMTALPEAITRDQLRIAIRHADFCSEIERLGESAEEARKMLFRPLAASICAVLMADFPTTMRSINQGDLGALELDANAAWTLAERQTLADLPGPEEFPQLGDAMVVVSEYDYTPSLLLDTAGWRRAAQAVDDDVIVAIPSDDFLVAIRRANLTDLEAFKETTRQAFETAPRGISPLVYRLAAEGWVPLD